MQGTDGRNGYSFVDVEAIETENNAAELKEDYEVCRNEVAETLAVIALVRPVTSASKSALCSAAKRLLPN